MRGRETEIKRRGITVIEVLIATGVVLLVAAILFPVFANAKSGVKKSQAIDNFRKLGSATNMYLADSNDLYPLAISYDTKADGWRFSGMIAVPAGSSKVGSPARNSAVRIAEESVAFPNSIFKYSKSTDILEGTGLQTLPTSISESPVPEVPQAKVNALMNGLLQSYPMSSVASPERLTLIWEGAFNWNLKGTALANPVLLCTGKGICKFQPNDYPPAMSDKNGGFGYTWWGWTDSSDSAYSYGKGMIFIHVDGSAKFVQGNVPRDPGRAFTLDYPFTRFAATPAVEGNPYFMMDCGPNGKSFNEANVLWPGFFRPDSDFSYTPDQCDY